MQIENVKISFKSGDRPGKMLKETTRDLARMIDCALNPLGASIATSPVIFALSEAGQMTQSELARYCNVEQPTMAQMLKRMEQAGTIEREKDPKDGRSFLYRLAPDFQDIKPKIESEVDGVYEIAFAGVSNQDYEIFRKVLKSISHNINQNEQGA